MILEAGHTIGNHTQTHPQFKFWRLDPKTLAKEIDEFEGTVSSLRAPVPLWFRAPAGLKNPFLHPILAARGLHLIGWNARAFDTQLGDCARIVQRIMESLKPGSIILFHESRQPKVCLEALERLLSKLRDEQFELILPQPHDLIAGRHRAVNIGSVSCAALRRLRGAAKETGWTSARRSDNFKTMDQYYVELAEALRDRLAVIANHQLRDQNPEAHLTKLREASERIENLRKRLPPDADPTLDHYLRRMSLSKALELVDKYCLG
jgi:Polysaccharide deacetylase